MKKPATLKAHLLQRTPYLKKNPAQLVVMVENGHLNATGAGRVRLNEQGGSTEPFTAPFTAAPALSFMYRYRLTVVVLDFPGDPEEITVPVLEWLQTNQPDMVDNPDFQDQGMILEVDYLDSGAVDLSISLDPITERIRVDDKDKTADPTFERFTMTTLDEPQRDDLLNALM